MAAVPTTSAFLRESFTPSRPGPFFCNACFFDINRLEQYYPLNPIRKKHLDRSLSLELVHHSVFILCVKQKKFRLVVSYFVTPSLYIFRRTIALVVATKVSFKVGGTDIGSWEDVKVYQRQVVPSQLLCQGTLWFPRFLYSRHLSLHIYSASMTTQMLILETDSSDTDHRHTHSRQETLSFTSLKNKAFSLDD